MRRKAEAKSEHLQELIHRRDKVLAVLHPPTAAHARIMERAGCEALFVGTGGVVGAYTGLSDVGTATMTECVTIAGWIADSVSIPVIMDGDTGHGGIMAVRRMVRECIRAGIAGIRSTTSQSRASVRRRARASRSFHSTRRLHATARQSTAPAAIGRRHRASGSRDPEERRAIMPPNTRGPYGAPTDSAGALQR